MSACRVVAALGMGLVLASQALLHAAPTRPQEQEQKELPPGAEGRLNNDSFLPTSPNAQSSLRRGDQALVQARASLETNPDEATRYYVECIDAWQECLSLGSADGSYWLAEGVQPRRSMTEGVAHGLRRRLRGLSPQERELWTERVSALARPGLAAAGTHAGDLKRVVRHFPLTLPAAHAGLMLADKALERGARTEASSWLQRALTDLPAEQLGGPLADAIGRRIEALPSEAEPNDLEPSDWGTATGFRVVSSLALGLDERQPVRSNAAGSQSARGERPGLVFLSKERMAVQTASQVHLLRITPRGALSTERAFKPTELRFEGGARLPFGAPDFDERRSRLAPGWQLRPAVSGNDLIVVSGQTMPEGLSNALLSIALPPKLLPGSLNLPGQAAEPKLNWAVLGNEWIDREGNSQELGLLAGLVDLEFQPGPVAVDNRVFVQARSYGDVVSTWLLCFDRHSGLLQWKHLLGTGSDLLEERGRLGSGQAPRLAAPPLSLVDLPGELGVRLFVSTNLGFSVLVDYPDGRPLWSLKNRRREHAELGWNGYPALLGTSADRPAIWWAPFDSDRLYALDPGPLTGEAPTRATVQLQPPLAIGESRTLLGGDELGIVVQGRAGRERVISSLSLDAKLGSMRQDALYLGPGEEFLGRGLISPTRVLACSERGLYLFDRTRELYLLSYTALPRASGTRKLAPGGDLYVQNGLVFALGKNGIWSFQPN